MSWATGRNTTPSEDREYALMGIFDVNIPILYGEGNERTFRRLHIEIIQRSYDTIIFAWGLRIALGLTRDSGCVAEGRVERWKYEREYLRSTNFLLPRLPDAFCVSIDLDRLPLVKLTSTLGIGMVDRPHFSTRISALAFPFRCVRCTRTSGAASVVPRSCVACRGRGRA
ncbi:hypothetical protein TRAPUB_7267 [Trametes pubescens]|uniref:DUF8212 domain-containing protein n=1 Tax=Trametes pubescens TaxID=154538 RepID=A0A1M2V3R1_TRAPU|nr:hypothetical protein TRAPUB_7267 [Trametes pubescens]